MSIAKDENGILQNVYSAFDEVYIDTPYLNTYLSNIENIHRKNKLSPIYKEKLNKEEVNTFIKILIENSVFYRLDITSTSIYKRDYKHKMRYQYNARTTCYQINQDYSIEFIDEYLNLKSILVSKMIWNLLIRASSDMGIARYRPNASCGIEEQDSQLVYKLRENAWIPSRSGEFMFPKDMTKKLLRDDFKYDDSNGLLTAIGFAEIYNKSEKKYLEEQQKAKDEGFSSLEDKKNMFEFYNFMKEKKLSFENVKAIIEKKYEFPKNNITNKERRYEKIEQDYNKATDKKYEVVKQSIRITNNKLRPGVLMRLKNEYTNLNDEMICQICKKVMPFKKRDGNYYFEAVELLSKEYFHKEYSAQYLALCPVCAAKYKEFVKRQKQIMEQLYKTILNADNLEIPVILGDEHQTISFVETHFHDLKMILSTITN